MWAEIKDSSLIIHYANQISKKIVRPATYQYSVNKVDPASIDVKAWVAQLLDRAYGAAQRKKRIKVLINPFGGQGRAAKYYQESAEPILAAGRCRIDVERTRFQGHAVEMVAALDVRAYDAVVCCSGDGLPYEVFNGLGKRADARAALARVAVAHLPCGTGNAMSWNLNGTDSPSLAALSVVKGIRMPLDLVSITQGETRTLSFLSQAIGIVADVDLGTENLRWMGDARITYGFLTRLLRKKVYPCDIAIKVEMESKHAIREKYPSQVQVRSSMEERRQSSDPPPSPRLGAGVGLPNLKYGTVNDKLPPDWITMPYNNLGSFYCGKMPYMAADAPFFAAAMPHDGMMDLITIDGDVNTLKSLKMMLDLPKNTLFDDPLVTYRKITGFRVTPKGNAGYIAIDGEHFAFAPFQGEVHQGLGTVLSRSGHLFEAEGVP